MGRILGHCNRSLDDSANSLVICAVFEGMGNTGVPITRRRVLQGIGALAGAAIIGSALDALLIEPRWIKISRVKILLEGWPRAFDGLRVAHLTDLHVSRGDRLDYLKGVVAGTKAEQPDVVVLTGDFVNHAHRADDELSAVLSALPCEGRRFAVLGNHDYWTDPHAVTRCLLQAGISPVTNRHELLRRQGATLAIAGVDDLWEGRPDLGAALRGVPEPAARLLLCHNPDFAESMAGTPHVDLMFAGHTHGGQVKLPFGRPPRAPIQHRKYMAGVTDGPHCKVFTSVGVGTAILPVRFNCRPELAILTLARAEI